MLNIQIVTKLPVKKIVSFRFLTYKFYSLTQLDCPAELSLPKIDNQHTLRTSPGIAEKKVILGRHRSQREGQDFLDTPEQTLNNGCVHYCIYPNIKGSICIKTINQTVRKIIQ